MSSSACPHCHPGYTSSWGTVCEYCGGTGYILDSTPPNTYKPIAFHEPDPFWPIPEVKNG